MQVRLIGLLSALVLAVLFYTQVFANGYVWDDTSLFVHSDYLRNPGRLLEGLTQPILAGTTYFRPLVLATFAGEFYFFGADPYVSHLLNVVIHGVNAALAGLLALKVSEEVGSDRRGQLFCFVAALLFYVGHPVLVESVAWAVGRFDLLVTTFYLLFLVLSVCSRISIGRVFLLSFIYLLALLCKEMAVTAPLVAVLIHSFAFGGEGASNSITLNRLRSANYHWLLVGCGAALASYLWSKYNIVGALSHVDHLVAELWPGGARLALVGQTVLLYAHLMFWPFSEIGPQHPSLGGVQSLSLFSLNFFIGLAALILAIAGVFRQSRLLTFYSALLISAAPVLNFVPLTIGGNVGHDRFMTLPLAIFSSLGAVSLWRLRSKFASPFFERVSIGFLVLWAAVCFLNVRVTVPLWKDELSLWAWAAARHGDFLPVRLNFVNALIERGFYSKALAEIERPLGAQYYGQSVRADLPLAKGHALLRMGDYSGALRVLQGMPSPERERIDVLVAKGLSPADWHIAKISRHSWAGFMVKQSLTAEALVSLRRFHDARNELRYAMFVNPDSQAVLLLDAFALYGLGATAEGDKVFERARAMMTADMAQNAVRLRASLLGQLCTGGEAQHCSRPVVLR